jgi:hypothetical protein
MLFGDVPLTHVKSAFSANGPLPAIAMLLPQAAEVKQTWQT